MKWELFGEKDLESKLRHIVHVNVCKTTRGKQQVGASASSMSKEVSITVCEALAMHDTGYKCGVRREDWGERPRYSYTESQVKEAATNIASIFLA